MDTLRYMVIKRLRERDKFARFGIYYPVVPGMLDGDMVIHSKVLIVDDRFIHIGSSNLTNRSMGLDTECDLAIETNGDSDVSGKISLFRNELLAEHLGVSIEVVDQNIKESNSLLRTVEKLRNSDRALKPLDSEAPEWLEIIAPALNVVDPEKPIDPSAMIQWSVPDQKESIGKTSYWKFLFFILCLVGLGAAWQWGPLGEWITTDTLAHWGSQIRSSTAAPLIIPAAFIIGGLLMCPLTLMIAATALVFDPVHSLIYAFEGSLAAAVANYAIGRVLGRKTLRTVAGSWLDRITRRLREKGLMAITTLRLIPIAPFSIVNIVMGTCRIHFIHYIVGTLIGLAPGIISITIFAGSLLEVFHNPGIRNLAFLIGIGLIIFLLFYWLKYYLKPQPSS